MKYSGIYAGLLAAVLLSGCSAGSAASPGTVGSSAEENEEEVQEVLYPIRYYHYETACPPMYVWDDEISHVGEGFYDIHNKSHTLHNVTTYIYTSDTVVVESFYTYDEAMEHLLEYREFSSRKNSEWMEAERYDQDGNATEHVNRNVNDNHAGFVRSEYDANGNCVYSAFYTVEDKSVVDPLNITWKEYENMTMYAEEFKEYTADGHLTMERRVYKDESGQDSNSESVYEYKQLDDYGSFEYYTASGKLDERVIYDENGNALEKNGRFYTYDSYGNVLTISGKATAEYTYDDQQRLLHRTYVGDKKDEEDTYTYNEDGSYSVESTTAEPSQAYAEYDADGTLQYYLLKFGDQLEKTTVTVRNGNEQDSYIDTNLQEDGSPYLNYGYCSEGTHIVYDEYGHALEQTEYTRYGMVRYKRIVTFDD